MMTGYYSATFRKGNVIHHWVYRNILDNPENFFRDVAEKGGVIPLSYQKYTLFGTKHKPYPKFIISTIEQPDLDKSFKVIENDKVAVVRFCGMDNNFIYYVGYDN